MEVAATAVGRRYAVADIVTGGLVLAVVTSLPNAVSAVYLARRGRGAAVLSTALNSNAINVVGGLLIPASLAGLGPGFGAGHAGGRVVRGPDHARARAGVPRPGRGPRAGTAIIAGYLAFVTALIITVEQGDVRPAAAVLPAVAVAGAGALLLALACGAASGPHLILIGLLIAGDSIRPSSSQVTVTSRTKGPVPLRQRRWGWGDGWHCRGRDHDQVVQAGPPAADRGAQAAA